MGSVGERIERLADRIPKPQECFDLSGFSDDELREMLVLINQAEERGENADDPESFSDQNLKAFLVRAFGPSRYVPQHHDSVKGAT